MSSVRKRLNPVALPFWPSAKLLLGAALSFCLSLGSVELIAATIVPGEPGIKSWWFVGVIAWLLSLVIAFTVGVLAIRAAFQRRKKTALLAHIVAAYFGLIFMFSGLYYNMSFAGDFDDAIIKYNHYRAQGQKIDAGLQSKALVLEDARYFRGIKQRLWSGVDWPVDENGLFPHLYSPGDFVVPVEDVLKNAKVEPMSAVVKFVPTARISVLVDCWHVSVVTMTTLGSGDILPSVWYSKLASDIQVLAGVVLLVIALGMAIGNWWEPKTVIRDG